MFLKTFKSCSVRSSKTNTCRNHLFACRFACSRGHSFMRMRWLTSGTNIWRLHTKLCKFGWHFCEERASEKRQRPDSWEIVYIAIIYYILDSWLFYCMVLEPYTEGKLRARSVQIVCFNKPSQSPLKRRGIYIRSALNEIQFFKRLQTATAFYDL